MLQAKRLSAPGLRSVLRTAFAAMWSIDGLPGIYWYVQGCKKDAIPEPGSVIAETNGATAIFKPDEVVMGVLKEAMAGTNIVLTPGDSDVPLTTLPIPDDGVNQLEALHS